MKKVLSFGLLCFLLFGLTTFSYADTTTTPPPAQGTTPPAQGTTPAPATGTSPITVTPPAAGQQPTNAPINIQPQVGGTQEPVPTDAKGKALYYLKHTWAAIITLLIIIVLLFMYGKESWGSKQ